MVGCKNISDFLLKPEVKLEELNLEMNNLGDTGLKLLITGLMSNKSLKIINLNK